jgi:uncharacterized protein YecT (DUF1311 family)
MSSPESTTLGFGHVKNVMGMHHSTRSHAAAFEVHLCLGIVIGIFLLVSWAPKPEAQQASTELTPTILVPTEWRPSLKQVQEDVEEGLAAQPHPSQQALNRVSQHLADLVDARLFITYVVLLQQLDEQGRQALFAEQQAWLTRRVTSARAAVTSTGGSLEPLEYTSAFYDITKTRLAELDGRLAQPATQPVRTPGKEGP